MSAYALVLAAGSGQRMGLSCNKVLAELCGKPVLWRAARAFDGLMDGLVVVAREAELSAVAALLPEAIVVAGGVTRQRSVLNGLYALPEGADIVLVHDGARPLVTRDIIRRCIESARAHGSGVAAVPVKATVKRAGPDGRVVDTPARASLYEAQTPQAFCAPALRAAIEALEARGETATDDAAAMEAAGESVRLVEGAYTNIKLTTPEDLAMAEWMLRGQSAAPRAGYGYDAHQLTEGRPLVLCGVEIPFEKGLLGHSDADVALHALMDALLGAACLGDIGRHFPDSDERYRGVSSVLLLEKVRELLAEKGWAVESADVTIVAERPKLKGYMERMCARTAEALRLSPDRVNVKATTTEGMGFEGEGLGMSAHATATIYRV